MNRIVIHIDRVTLRGVPPGERNRVVAELQESLIHHLSQPGAADRLAGIGHLESVRAPATGPVPAERPPAGRSPAEGPPTLGRTAGLAIARTLAP